MKTTATQEQIGSIIKALALIHIKPFGQESGDPKCDAQRNLRGRTHYCDDDTLRWHHSRITGGHAEHSGLVYVLTCSDALDMHNARRGFRSVVFDVFGTVVSRDNLEDAKSTSNAARKVADNFELDLLAHYRGELASRIRHQKQDLEESEAALASLGS